LGIFTPKYTLDVDMNILGNQPAEMASENAPEDEVHAILTTIETLVRFFKDEIEYL
jgi:hypothetical protein